MGREDSGTPGRGTPGRGDPGTPGRGTRGRGIRGRKDEGTSGREDVINKQHLNFTLNLQFTIIGGYYMVESLPVADDFQRP